MHISLKHINRRTQFYITKVKSRDRMKFKEHGISLYNGLFVKLFTANFDWSSKVQQHRLVQKDFSRNDTHFLYSVLWQRCLFGSSSQIQKGVYNIVYIQFAFIATCHFSSSVCCEDGAQIERFAAFHTISNTTSRQIVKLNDISSTKVNLFCGFVSEDRTYFNTLKGVFDMNTHSRRP